MDPIVLRVAARYVDAIIRKEKGEYCVRSPNNSDWNGGCYPSKGEAEKRLKQVEFFKRQASYPGQEYKIEHEYDGLSHLYVWEYDEDKHGFDWVPNGSVESGRFNYRGTPISDSDIRAFEKIAKTYKGPYPHTVKGKFPIRAH